MDILIRSPPYEIKAGAANFIIQRKDRKVYEI